MAKLRLSRDKTLEEIDGMLKELSDLLYTAHRKMDILNERIAYYTDTLDRRP